MQAACQTVALPNAAMLAVIEDETGAGKTEAALILAHRMLQAGKGRGIYFALPTMATADAMFARTADAISGIFTSAPGCPCHSATCLPQVRLARMHRPARAG
jgi:CRISPR-associated endonuclease/helicase Cas3